MTFTSYAQNFEDVILRRALKDVDRGFYIDIGANDPVVDSVSLAFYEIGWRGVHVEPVGEYADKLRRSRPDERVIEAAVADSDGEVRLYEVNRTGLTTQRKRYADVYKAQGMAVKRISVPAVPLARIFEDVGERDIHWLKIDVEGMEQAVLKSWRDARARPWIVVVESVVPNKPIEDYGHWEEEVFRRGYSFVYFDGLNRFYVHESRETLISAFGPGPNYFDGFELAEHSVFGARLRARADALSHERDEAVNKLEREEQTSLELLATIRAQAEGLSEAIDRALAAQALEASDNRMRLDARTRELESELTSTRATLEALRVDFSRLEAESAQLERLRSDLETIQNERDQLSQELGHQRQETHKLERALNEVQTDRNVLRESVDKLSATIDEVAELVDSGDCKDASDPEQKLLILGRLLSDSLADQKQLETQLRDARDQFNQERQHLLEQNENVANRIAELSGQYQSALTRIDELEGELLQVRISTSWKLTAPVRWLGNLIYGVADDVKIVVHFLLEKLLGLVRRFPALKPPILSILRFTPRLRRRLIAFGQVRPMMRYGQPTAARQPRARVSRLKEATITRTPRSVAKSARDESGPLLSICVTTFNRARWLEYGLSAIIDRAEGFERIVEIIVCDNASTDDTEEVVQKYLGRPNFRYHRNAENVGMLGNLGVTANHAKGKFVWIIGDDDIILDGALAKILDAIQRYPNIELVYTNYSFTHLDVDSFETYQELEEHQTPIADPVEDCHVPELIEVAANTDNFFTAIYCCIFRADHARAAFNQNTSGQPFSSLLTCVPSTQYVLDRLLLRPAYWVGEPAILVNMNVSWLRYADLWVLERFPEMYQKFEEAGVPSQLVDHYRRKSIDGVVHHLRDAVTIESENLSSITMRRLLTTYKHMEEFQRCLPELMSLIDQANQLGSRIDVQALADPFPGPVAIEGPFVGSYSLALVNRAIAASLASLGGQVSIAPSPTEGTPFEIEPEQVDPTTWELYGKELSRTGAAGVVLRYTFPPTTEGMGDGLKLYHSFGWEESGIPMEYVEGFNKSLDGISVMSRFVEKVLRDHGLLIPVRVAGIGTDHLPEACVASERLAAARENDRKFTFLHISSCFPRKGVDVLLQAFAETFDVKDQVRLVIKTFPNPHNDVEHQVSILGSQYGKLPEICVINEDWSEQQKLNELYKEADVLVAPSRGEGFGLPIAEALYAYMPVIATGFGGQIDMLGKSYPWLIDFEFEHSQSHFGQWDSYWANPDAKDLGRLMRAAFKSTPEERLCLAEEFRDRILARFRWEHVAKRTAAFLEDLSSSSSGCQNTSSLTPMGCAFVTSWNTRCGIAEYSRNLLCAFHEDEIEILAPTLSGDDVVLGEDEKNVKRLWEPHVVDGLIDTIPKIQGNVIVIQHQPSFMTLAALARVVRCATNEDKFVIVFFHNVQNFVDTCDDRDIEVFSDLRVSLCVHTVRDLNLIKLREPNLIDNTILFPHGTAAAVEVETSGYQSKEDDSFVVSTFGFLLPHKGVAELIEALSIVRERCRKCTLKLHTSILDERSVEYAEKCRNLIADLDLSEYVSFNTDFLAQEEALLELSSSDLIVLPYGTSTESVSGAVRLCLSSGVPVLCSPSPIFQDLNGVVGFLPSDDPVDIGEAILDRISDRELLYSTRSAQSDWTSQHDWRVLSERLHNIVLALR